MLPLSKSNMRIVNTMYELLNFFFTYSSQKEKIGIDRGNSKSVIWVNNTILSCSIFFEMGSLCVSLQTKILKRDPLVSTTIDPFTVYFHFCLGPVSEKSVNTTGKKAL